MQKKAVHFNGANWRIFYRDLADESVVGEIFKFREYRAAENIIKSAKEPIVDVGAHAGFFSLYCRALNRLVKIYALEPEVDNIKMFKQHIKINNIKGVKLIAGALAGASGERELVISADSHNHRLAPADSLSKENRVKAYSIADFCQENKLTAISLLKMDIEGGEYEVLASTSPRILSMVGAVIMEYHNSRTNNFKIIENQLRKNGFSVEIFPSHFDKNMGFIFARNKRIE